MSRRPVLVTGGAGSLGRAVVGRLARDDQVVVLDASSARPGDPGGRHIDAGVRHLTVDLRDLEAVRDAVERARDEVGEPFALVCCAGIGPTYQPALELAREQVHRIVDVNVLGVLNACRAVAPAMTQAGGGRIVNISSVTARGGWAGRSEYAASKAALESFSLSLAVELGRSGITVNCVAPGHMRTAMTEDGAIPWGSIVDRTALGRLVTTDEVAAAVAFLLSDGAAGITGAVLPVDAGYLANQMYATTTSEDE